MTDGFSSVWHSEKHAVVFDFGRWCSKLGIGNDLYPARVVFTPELHLEKYHVSSKYIKCSPPNSMECQKVLSTFLRKSYFSYLNVNPKDRKVVLCLSIMTTPTFRDTIIKILFEQLEVPSISIISDVSAALYTCGISSGIFVDVGYCETRVIPILFGSTEYGLFTQVDVGGRSVDEKLKSFLIKSNPNYDLIHSLSAEELEKIKVEACYVKYELGSKNHSLQSDFEYQINEDIVIRLDADYRWKSCEVLFGSDNEECDPDISIQKSIINCLERCTMDVRRKVIQNILICGGTAEFPGFTTRLAIELNKLIDNSDKVKHLKRLIRFGSPSFEPLIRQWAGSSIYSMLEGIEECTLSEYKEGRRIKDWSNM